MATHLNEQGQSSNVPFLLTTTSVLPHGIHPCNHSGLYRHTGPCHLVCLPPAITPCNSTTDNSRLLFLDEEKHTDILTLALCFVATGLQSSAFLSKWFVLVQKKKNTGQWNGSNIQGEEEFILPTQNYGNSHFQDFLDWNSICIACHSYWVSTHMRKNPHKFLLHKLQSGRDL